MVEPPIKVFPLAVQFLADEELSDLLDEIENSIADFPLGDKGTWLVRLEQDKDKKDFVYCDRIGSRGITGNLQFYLSPDEETAWLVFGSENYEMKTRARTASARKKQELLSEVRLKIKKQMVYCIDYLNGPNFQNHKALMERYQRELQGSKVAGKPL